MWWDEETDGELLYPKEAKHPTAEEFAEAQFSNPDETAARGALGPTHDSSSSTSPT